MTITLALKNNKYFQEIEYQKNGKRYYSSSNNQPEIRRNIKELLENIHHCFFYDDKLIVKYSSDIKLVIEDFKKIKKQDIQLRGEKSLLSEIWKVTAPLLKGKVKNISYRRIASLGLTAMIVLSTLGYHTSQTNQTANNKTAIPTSFLQKQNNPFKMSQNRIENLSILSPENIDITSFWNDTSNFDLETRIMQSQNLYNQTTENSSGIPLGVNLTEYALSRMVKFLNSTGGQYEFEYGKQFGGDPYLLSALAMTEASLYHEEVTPKGQYFNGHAVGRHQIEEPERKNSQGQDRTVTALNYSTDEMETMAINMENACDEEKNTKLAAMLWQNKIEYYQGNIYMAIQSYNFGGGKGSAINLAVTVYADSIGKTYDDVARDMSDIGWIAEIQKISANPQQYAIDKEEKYGEQFSSCIQYLKNWQYTTYGNGDYIAMVLSYYVGTVSENKYADQVIITDLITLDSYIATIESPQKNI